MNENEIMVPQVEDPAVKNEKAINERYAQIAGLRNRMMQEPKELRRKLLMSDIAGLELEIVALSEGREVSDQEKLAVAKERKGIEIQLYDQSAEVNRFSLVGKQMWLPKETRVGLVNSISIEKAAGKPNTVLWFDGVRYEIPIEQALKMLGALEMYALECYNVTHKHLSEVDKLLSVDAVAGYDHKAGYPEKLNFDSVEIKTIN